MTPTFHLSPLHFISFTILFLVFSYNFFLLHYKSSIYPTIFIRPPPPDPANHNQPRENMRKSHHSRLIPRRFVLHPLQFIFTALHTPNYPHLFFTPNLCILLQVKFSFSRFLPQIYISPRNSKHGYEHVLYSRNCSKRLIGKYWFGSYVCGSYQISGIRKRMLASKWFLLTMRVWGFMLV
ncbi:hypothetical protein ABFS83_05G084300 [Erythranthe nasuta]